MKTILIVAIALSFAGCTASGQLTPGGTTALNVTAVSLEALTCGLQIVVTDEGATPPAPATQLAFDLAEKCGMDLVAIGNLFGAQSPVTMAAASNTAQIQAKVDTWRASHVKK